MPTRDEHIEQTARRFRVRLGLDDRFLPDVIFVLKELKRTGEIKDFICVADEKMPQQEARWDAEERIVYIRQRTFDVLDRRFSKDERRRARFTLAHELAHIAWGHEGVHYRGAINARQLALKSRVFFDEVEANKFAAAFLIPLHLAGAEKSTEDLSDLFDVNLPVATFRKPVLERMNRRAKGIPRPLPPSVIDFLNRRKPPKK
jgi:hypothetical protein